MKKFMYLPLLAIVSLLSFGCSSKEDDATPSYANYTPVTGTFAISKNGAASYNLTDLKLKVTKNTTTNLDVYEFRGTYNNLDGVDVSFYLDPKRTGSGPYTVPSLATYYTGGFAGGSQTLIDSSPSATFSTANNKFSGSFSGTKLSGRLSQ